MFGTTTTYRYGETGPSTCRGCGLQLEQGDTVRLIDRSREWLPNQAEHDDCRKPLASAISSLRYELSTIKSAQLDALMARKAGAKK